MAEQVGEVKIQLRADSAKLDSDLKSAESKTTSKLSAIGKKVGAATAAAVATATAAATAAVASVTSKSVELYASFEQSIGGVETLFKDSAAEVIANADTAFRRVGLSANDYMEQATSFSASLIQSLGGDTAKAAEYADRAIVAMSDNANKMGSSMESIQNAYNGFAKQNYTMLDNLKLGYGGTKEEMLRLIADASTMTEEMERLGITVDATSDDFGNIVNAIAVVQEHMGIAGTSIAEAEETIAGSQKMLKTSIDDLVRGFADPEADLGKLLDNMTNSAITFGKNFGKAIMRALPNIVTGIRRIAEEIIKELPNIIQTVIPPFVEAVGDVAIALLDYVPALLDTTFKVVMQVANGLIQKLPEILTKLSTIIVSIVDMLTKPENINMILNAGVQLLIALVKAIPQIIQMLAVAIPQIITNIIDWLTDPETIKLLIVAAVELFMAIVQAVPQIFGALMSAWGELFVRMKGALKENFEGFMVEMANGTYNLIAGALNSVIGWIEGAINGVINAVNGAINAINSIPGVNLGTLQLIQWGRIPLMANGGVVNGATHAIIGEAGPEAVIPLTRDTGWAKAIAGAITEQFASEGAGAGRTVNVYMTNQINNKLDIDEVSRELVTSIRRAI